MATFRWLGFILVPIIIHAQTPTDKICLSTQSHCSFDCNEQLDWTYSCKSVSIDGRAAKSLSVSCKDEACQYSNIYCPQNCFIHCIDPYSCQLSTVFYDDSDNINNPPNITLKCESNGCSVMNITSYTTDINSNMNKPNGGSLNIIAAQSGGPRYIYGNRMNEINWWCNDRYACSGMVVYGYQINKFNMYCPDYQYQNCYDIDVYCNSNIPDSCNFHNCHCDTYWNSDTNDMHLNTSLLTDPNNFYKFLNIGYSPRPFQIYCDYHTQVYWNDWPKDNKYFTSTATWQNELYRFDCTDMYCCPFKNISYECTSKQCGVQCDNCYGKQIDGGEIAESLFVICPSQNDKPEKGSCAESIIYCPTKSNSICSVYCEAYSCNNTIILSPKVNNKIILNCVEPHSCNNVRIIGDYASEISVYCDASDSSSATNILDGFCNSLKINGKYVSNKIELYCIGDYACNNQTKIYGEYANTIKLFADGYQSMYLGEIHAEYSNHLSISCKNDISIDNIPQQGGTGGCYFTSIYAPTASTALFDLQCIGTGCYYLNIYQPRLSLINNFNITVNPCGKCNDISNCIDHWNIYCGVNSTYSTSTAYWGSHCDSLNCNCNLLASNYHYNQSSINGCHQNIITTTTTLPPTISFKPAPTQYPSGWFPATSEPSPFRPSTFIPSPDPVSTFIPSPDSVSTFIPWPTTSTYTSSTSSTSPVQKSDSKSKTSNTNVIFISAIVVLLVVVIGLVVFIGIRQKKLKTQLLAYDNLGETVRE